MVSLAFVSPSVVALSCIVVIIVSIAHRIIYNVYFHPLRSYPGPFWAKATVLWHLYHIYHADNHKAVHQLHLKYGPVVRVAPNEIVYTSPNIWKPIFGHKVNAPENVKDPSQSFRVVQGSQRDSMLMAPREEHGKMRRLLSHSFSDKALKEQEPIFTHYVDLLMEKLHDACVEPVDIVKWFNFTTFDIIGHLVFAEPFDCLSSTEYHFWVAFFFHTVKAISWSRALNRLSSSIVPALMRLLPKRILNKGLLHFEMSKEKLARRRQRQLDYTDFLSGWISAEEKGILDPEDLEMNVPLLIGAGSETTATLLSGATYLIGKDPRVYRILVEEIRSAFQTKEDIRMDRLPELKYLSAVLDEALRLYPPTPTNRVRLLPPQGMTIEGQYVPGNTLVGINFYAAFRSESNFHRGEEFVPERVLRDERADDEWSHDRRDVLQPFSYGPRNCIGRHLALVEMRLIMARLLYEFDVEIMPENEDWLDQKSYAVWEKPPQMVRLRPVVKA
ncbi:uncharacterized protein N0V89_006149 [Didymosphaeria variabile]|uniref:Cytochrome P450 n=1 Tax=Didymosphaeria variabile TaxID=1932322 RepID=A0A9W9CCE4_9PLEO|nr:uncharacterized protein N0V89_006149 [Didymosphaeria variabile]KAJ4354413.1 hypothetical protein N0V89_006149 [Didymosphaeria variabile]